MPDNNGKKKRNRRKFTDEFKRDAAALVLDTGRPIAQVARELDVYESSLGRSVADLRMERELLKRSVAYVGDRVKRPGRRVG